MFQFKVGDRILSKQFNLYHVIRIEEDSYEYVLCLDSSKEKEQIVNADSVHKYGILEKVYNSPLMKALREE